MLKVSIIIPAYNAITYLPRTLNSVLNQTFTNFEVLIVNDGSSDSIIPWANKLIDPRVKLISQTNQGASAARNTGLAHAQGEYIAFLDADDLWQPTKLEQQVRCLDQQPEVGLVYTWTALIDEKDHPTGGLFASDIEGDVWEQMVVDDPIGNGSSPMIRRSCFEKVGKFDTNLKSVEDFDMWLRVAADYPIVVIKEPLTLYRQHTTSKSKNYSRVFQNACMVIEKAFRSVPKELLGLKKCAYGNVHLGFAWLYVDQGDYKKANHFRRQSLCHNPQLRYSQKCLRLSLAIFMIRWFGPNGYDGFRKLTRYLRRLVLGVKLSCI